MKEQQPVDGNVRLSAGLERPDMRVIRNVYSANAEFGLDMPFLVSPRQQKRAKALAVRGLLKAHGVKLAPNPEGWDGFSVTQAGIDAYNAALRSNARAHRKNCRSEAEAGFSGAALCWAPALFNPSP